MSKCLCLILACTRQDNHVLVLAARTSLVPTCHSSQVWAKQDGSQSAPRCVGGDSEPCPDSSPLQGTRDANLHPFQAWWHHKLLLPGSQPGWAVRERQE